MRAITAGPCKHPDVHGNIKSNAAAHTCSAFAQHAEERSSDVAVLGMLTRRCSSPRPMLEGVCQTSRPEVARRRRLALQPLQRTVTCPPAPQSTVRVCQQISWQKAGEHRVAASDPLELAGSPRSDAHGEPGRVQTPNQTMQTPSKRSWLLPISAPKELRRYCAALLHTA